MCGEKSVTIKILCWYHKTVVFLLNAIKPWEYIGWCPYIHILIKVILHFFINISCLFWGKSISAYLVYHQRGMSNRIRESFSFMSAHVQPWPHEVWEIQNHIRVHQQASVSQGTFKHMVNQPQSKPPYNALEIRTLQESPLCGPVHSGPVDTTAGFLLRKPSCPHLAKMTHWPATKSQLRRQRIALKFRTWMCQCPQRYRLGKGHLGSPWHYLHH